MPYSDALEAARWRRGKKAANIHRFLPRPLTSEPHVPGGLRQPLCHYVPTVTHRTMVPAPHTLPGVAAVVTTNNVSNQLHTQQHSSSSTHLPAAQHQGLPRGHYDLLLLQKCFRLYPTEVHTAPLKLLKTESSCLKEIPLQMLPMGMWEPENMKIKKFRWGLFDF